MSQVIVTIEVRNEDHPLRGDTITVVGTRIGRVEDGVIGDATDEAVARANAAATVEEASRG